VIDGDWYVTGCGDGGGEGGKIFRPGHNVFCGRCGALASDRRRQRRRLRLLLLQRRRRRRRRRRCLIRKECGPSATLPSRRPPAVRLRMWNVKCTTRARSPRTVTNTYLLTAARRNIYLIITHYFFFSLSPLLYILIAQFHSLSVLVSFSELMKGKVTSASSYLERGTQSQQYLSYYNNNSILLNIGRNTPAHHNNVYYTSVNKIKIKREEM